MVALFLLFYNKTGKLLKPKPAHCFSYKREKQQKHWDNKKRNVKKQEGNLGIVL